MVDDTAEDAKLMGIELPDEKRDNDYEVLPEAWPAVEMFLRVQTQWRVGMAGLIGLDYAAVKWCFELEDVSKPSELLSDLQVIEARVLEVLSERNG